MMRQIALDIANAGSNAVLFDFIGHGSNSDQLVNNPTELSGTTQQLVDQLIRVIDFLETEYGSDIKLYLIGHSMASDIVIRASEYKNISSIAAISPYSTKVTKNFPNDLLLISGQFEKHLRSHSLKFTQLLDPSANENIEYSNGPNRRKASYTENTGHVSVIYSPKTSIRDRRLVQAKLLCSTFLGYAYYVDLNKFNVDNFWVITIEYLKADLRGER
jgi:pimeloyl-ACP methyl ester carboxylesterase